MTDTDPLAARRATTSNASSLRLVLFDCDGTLVDSQHIIVEAMTRAFASHGFAPPPRTAILGIIGLSLPQAVGQLVGPERAEATLDVVAAYKDSFRDLRSAASHNEPLFPGIADLIADLQRDERTLIGMVTGKSRRGVDVILDRFDFRGRFVTIQTADDAPSKPDPTMVERALGETGAPRTSTVVIGDTTFDMQMAKAAGTAAIGVSWGYHPTDKLAPAGADRVVASVAELPDAIAELTGDREDV
ncbi:HAD-IA family hydrolase [Amorphus sp. 3PC139-8]|uniref:HAD-IA family hydrolase n=1 Tax=Amorphus sp. 3PC139-8 TaxID=2735676 RepID=UPI00345CA79C